MSRRHNYAKRLIGWRRLQVTVGAVLLLASLTSVLSVDLISSSAGEERAGSLGRGVGVDYLDFPLGTT